MTEVALVRLHDNDPQRAYEQLLAAVSVPGDATVREAATFRRRNGVPDSEEGWGKDLMHSVTSTGGFTFHDMVGDGPRTGYMVSVAKETEQKVPLRDLTPEHVADYMSIHQQALKNPDNFLGGWVYKGNVYLDVSRHVARLDEALALAREHNQIGIYDLGRGETILTADQKAAVLANPTAEEVDDPAKRLAFASSFTSRLQQVAGDYQPDQDDLDWARRNTARPWE